MGTAVLLLGAEGLAAEQRVRAARQLGVGLHVATTRALYEQCGDRLRKQLSGVVFTDFHIPECAVDHLAAYYLREGIGAVAVSRDSLSPTAAALSARLRLPGHDPDRASAACNRWHMAQAFRENGVPSPFTLVIGSPETADEQVRAAELEGSSSSHPPTVRTPRA
ncbi:hypothetical protein NX801_00970 [Streptomyces sp. LP05-1]|uniref:Uncharacterized protein n=1 Tax=Streptomyces pyxinae TaxID=2970734 RepID=A0ABT2CA52_9ACTN|nr:hypothetical protein [Streptomyces sp. LP05-1]MCS0634259.1 hypothetical protein [Streptomyces sp. LP05-1]